MEATLAGILLYDLLDSFTAFTLYTAFGKSSKQFRDALISQNGVFLFLFFLDVSFLGEFFFLHLCISFLPSIKELRDYYFY